MRSDRHLPFYAAFQRGPLSKVGRGPLVTGIVFAVVLVAPAYRLLANAFWRHGIIRIISPGPLKDYWGDTGAKVRAAFAQPTEPEAMLSSDGSPVVAREPNQDIPVSSDTTSKTDDEHPTSTAT